MLTELVTETATVSRDAILSIAWKYPLTGIVYFISRPSLYKAVAPTLVKVLLASLVITAALFFFTYLPQVAFCALFSGPFAFFTAALMVLGESYALITVFSKAFLLTSAQDKLFDAVLLQQGNEALVSQGRDITKTSTGFKVLGKSMMKPLNRFSKEGILRYIVSLPLNSIPAIGTVLFLMYNGIKAGPGFHARYFQLKRMSSYDSHAFVEKHRGAYTAFGAVAITLNLIPVIGTAFNLTSSVGAALWASQLEQRGATAARERREVMVEM
ncbi:hypothetical protein BDQ17DRAFT_1243764 [Cyathus striatus]|nr:hypothetical protein BDQ17DRAFT_1243764 [Cyathus striatus]